MLMNLFLDSLVREIEDLHRNQVRVRFIGYRELLGHELGERMRSAEALTEGNLGLGLTVAIAYGGRWDIAQACRSLAADVAAGKLLPGDITEAQIGARLALGAIPDPDLLIRTGSEQRISNFLLWNFAYTELHFSDVFWPEFTPAHLDAAFEKYARRERRFGKTSGQLVERSDA